MISIDQNDPGKTFFSFWRKQDCFTQKWPQLISPSLAAAGAADAGAGAGAGAGGHFNEIINVFFSSSDLVVKKWVRSFSLGSLLKRFRKNFFCFLGV